SGSPKKPGCARPSRARSGTRCFEVRRWRRALTAPFRFRSSQAPKAGSTRSSIRRQLGRDDAIGVDNRLATLDLVDVSHALGHLTPNGVFAVEKRCIGKADEELAVAGVGRLRPRHRYGPSAVRLFVELRLELLARATRPGAVGTAGLRHKAFDHAMKDNDVVKALAHEILEARDLAEDTDQ